MNWNITLQNSHCSNHIIPFLWLFLWFSGVTHAQIKLDHDGVSYRKHLSKKQLQKHILYLTSEACMGRKIGTPGEEKAAQYIADQFEENAINPFLAEGYYQSFAITPKSLQSEMLIDGQKMSTINNDFILWQGTPAQFRWKRTVDLKEGYFIRNDSVLYYPEWMIKDKVIVLKDGWNENNTLFDVATEHKDDYHKITHYLTYEPKAIIWVSDVFNDFQDIRNNVFDADYVLYDELSYAYETPIMIFPEALDFNASQINIFPEVDTAINVLASIEGSDVELKDEWVLVTAHYDHLGIENGRHYPGADDNASGCAALIEMARLFKRMKKNGKGPKRSILFAAFSGEEFGLLGSSYFAKDGNLPPDKISAVLNMDMMGRKTQSTDKEDHIYIIGAGLNNSGLGQILAAVNQLYFDYTLDEQYNSRKHPERIYYRSDHYPFIEQKIPAMMFFSGFHEDYHSMYDTEEKINYSHLINVSRLVWTTALHIANHEKKLNFQK